MIKTKKQMFTIIGVFTLVMLLGTVTYAFFNYTRTGSANNIRTGRISFTSSQSGTINLTNVFPISRNDLANDEDNSDEVVITITGDTNYSNGLEYLITVEDVNVETSTHKKLPIGIEITPEKTGELGTEDVEEDEIDYFTDRGSSTSYYKVLASNVLKDGDYILVGYIRPGVAEVNGTIGIKAFIDKDKILISDTYDGTESDNMGTSNSIANGKTVLTTNEWNSLEGNNAISFKVRVQSNEGIWVGEPLSRNDMINIDSENTFTSAQKSSITEINFIRMSEEMINTHSNAIDISGTNGVVKAWIDGTILYIASPGETYFPVNSSYLFSGYSNATRINFNNINTSYTTNMARMFDDGNNLEYIDLSGFDMNNTTLLSGMFSGCANLTSLDLSGLGGNNLSNVAGMFSGCTNLTEINMSGFNFGSSLMRELFKNLINLEKINMNGANTSNVTEMSDLFYGCSSLEKVDLSNLGGNNLSVVSGMFSGCSNLREINMSGFNFGVSGYFGVANTNIEKIDFSNAIMSGLRSMNAGFQNCTSLKIVDFTGVSLKNDVTVNMLFSGCSNLETIVVSNGTDWSSILSSQSYNQAYGMFDGCTSLVGGAGTTYDASNIDGAYARVDGGPSNPGYFTVKN